jgi:hypothetical protein
MINYYENAIASISNNESFLIASDSFYSTVEVICRRKIMKVTGEIDLSLNKI